MKRRDLFAKLGTLAAAAALAPAAPAVEASTTRPTYQLLRNADGTVSFVDEQNVVFTGAPTREMLDALSDARAAGYRAGWETAKSNAEYKAKAEALVPPVGSMMLDRSTNTMMAWTGSAWVSAPIGQDD